MNSYNPSISPLTVDTAIWQIERWLMTRYGNNQASIDVDPLRWYCNTCRASTDFLHALVNAKPYMVARRLHQGGSCREAIDRVRAYLEPDDRQD